MSIRSTSFDYVTVGHVTVDVLAADSSRRPGGGAFYSALQAARLGLRTLIVTQGSPPELEAMLEPYRSELELCILPAPATTTLRTSWAGARRRQRLLAWAGPIAQTIEVDTRILHFAPVARETTGAWRGNAALVGLTPQGLVRGWDRDDEPRGDERPRGDEPRIGDPGEPDEPGAEIYSVVLPSDDDLLGSLLPRGCSALVISEQERAACVPLLTMAAANGAVLAITAGPAATSVRPPGGEVIQVQAPTVNEPCDDLGAGDVFAATFFVALHEGLSPERAAARGNAAAAIRVEGVGAGAIADRRAIEARLAGWTST
jgi:pfkB family carbohydrate kinase